MVNQWDFTYESSIQASNFMNHGSLFFGLRENNAGTLEISWEISMVSGDSFPKEPILRHESAEI